MGQKLRSQIARVAVVALPNVRMSSIGIMRGGFAMARDHIRRQYGAIDVLPAADKFDVVVLHTVSLDGRPVVSACGQRLEVDGTLGTDAYDIVVLCDFELAHENLNAITAQLTPWLRQQASGGATIAVSGQSAHIFAHSGLADGRVLAAPLAALDDVPHSAVFDKERDVIIDNEFISSRGGAADFTGALHLVERITSRNVGRWLAMQWGIEGYGLALHDPLMVRAEAYLQEHFSRQITVTALATALSVDRRTLHRRCVAATGQPPMAYLHSIRIEAAKNMLIRTSFTMDRIAGLVGYSDSGHFRALFRKVTGQSPREWRRTTRQSQM